MCLLQNAEFKLYHTRYRALTISVCNIYIVLFFKGNQQSVLTLTLPFSFGTKQKH